METLREADTSKKMSPETQGSESVLGRESNETAQEVTSKTNWGPHTYLSINIGDLPSQDHTAYGALHLLSFKRGPVSLREGHVAGDCPLVL